MIHFFAAIIFSICVTVLITWITGRDPRPAKHRRLWP